ncbi:MAG TPA: hypothetical protein VMT16_11205, partial [Thermoanaerobaculia bacterium]|nr:hypothetical protein [Thermoanaerobaculia bacterium]
TSVLARPRLTVGLPARFAATLGYIPPLEIDGVTPHLVTLALERLLYDGRRWRLGMRLHGQAGRVDGDITCDRDTVAAGEDRDRNPLGCLARSSDRLEVRTAGADATVALPLAGAPRLEPFLGVGINYFDLELAVDARYGNVIDRTRLVTSGSAWNATLGIAWLATERWVLSGEVFYTPLEVQRRFAAPRRTEELVNARAMLRYRLR